MTNAVMATVLEALSKKQTELMDDMYDRSCLFRARHELGDEDQKTTIHSFLPLSIQLADIMAKDERQQNPLVVKKLKAMATSVDLSCHPAFRLHGEAKLHAMLIEGMPPPICNGNTPNV